MDYGIINTKVVPCDLCGSCKFELLYRKSDSKLGLGQEYDIVQCANCGLAFVNPQPLQEEYRKFYSEQYYENRDTKEWEGLYEVRSKYIKKLPGKSLLDIGCAKGDFLNYISKYGYRVCGYEEFCGENPYDFTIHSGSPQGMIQRNHEHDIVTAWGVLEHLARPSVYFDMAAKALRKDGHFLFLVTNIESVASRYLYEEDIPRHTTFFSPKTIKMYAAKNGFEVKKIYHNNDVYSLRHHEFLGWVLSKLSGREFSQYDTFVYKRKNNERISPTYIRLSSLVGKLIGFYEQIFNKNGIITAVLQKK